MDDADSPIIDVVDGLLTGDDRPLRELLSINSDCPVAHEALAVLGEYDIDILIGLAKRPFHLPA